MSERAVQSIASLIGLWMALVLLGLTVWAGFNEARFFWFFVPPVVGLIILWKPMVWDNRAT